jgi:hypothetical protein
MRLKMTFVFFHRRTGIDIVIPAQAGMTTLNAGVTNLPQP